MYKNEVLSNDFLTIEINLIGAEIIRFETKNGKPVFWQKETNHWNRVAPVLFPFVGRLKNNSFQFNGLNYEMPQHGFARDKKFICENRTDNSITFLLKSTEETTNIYPFEFEFRIQYTLKENKLFVAYKIKNTDTKALYFSVGGHPAFQLNDVLENYFLQFEKPYVVSKSNLENGIISSQEKMELPEKLLLSNSLFEKDALVFLQPDFTSLSLYHNYEGKLIDFSCKDWNAIGIWTKPGAPFICIEPWLGYADVIDSNGLLNSKKGITELTSGRENVFNYEIAIHFA